MYIKIAIDEIELDIISKRLKNLISPGSILKWLNNFEKNEVPIAIKLLKNLTLYTSAEIEEAYQNGLKEILQAIPSGSRFAIHPIGSFGKSGSMMTYLLAKTPVYLANKNRIELCHSSSQLADLSVDFDVLVLLDDFLGTGNSVRQYYDSDIAAHVHRFPKCYFLGVAAMTGAFHRIKSLFTKVIIEESHIFKKSFSTDASYFGYRKHADVRALAYKYGKLLTKPEKLKNGNMHFGNALGYENSQSLVSFFYGSPNNSLPIFWQQDTNLPWHAITPRFSYEKISQAKDFRKRLSFELSILNEFGSASLRNEFSTFHIKKGGRGFSSANHINFSIYGILKLKRDGFGKFAICQQLGISTKDYQEYLIKGKMQGVFDKNEEITVKGLELYVEAKKCIASTKKIQYDKIPSDEFKNNIYFPGSFNGRT